MQHGQKSASPKDHSNLDFYPNLLGGGAERENTVNVLADIDVYCKCSDKMANVTTNPVTLLRCGWLLGATVISSNFTIFLTLQDTDVISYYWRAAMDFTERFTEQFTETLKGNRKEEHVTK